MPAATAEQMETFAADRRGHSRSSSPQGLIIEFHDASGARRLVPGKLVDYSGGGIGIEMLLPLPPGAMVWFSGDLHSTHYCVGLRGRGRVVHCLYGGQGVFRVGVACEDVNQRALGCPHEHHQEPDDYIPS